MTKAWLAGDPLIVLGQDKGFSLEVKKCEGAIVDPLSGRQTSGRKPEEGAHIVRLSPCPQLDTENSP